MTGQPLMTFKSHIQGVNADVAIYQDRVEWSRPRALSVGKLAAGFLTGGASLLATGVRGSGGDSEVIPVKSISSVTTERDGLMYTSVKVICSGNSIGFRVGHSEAPQVKALLTQLILGSHPSQQPAAAPHPIPVQPPVQVSEPTSNPQVDGIEQLKRLAQLRDAGVLTEEEFQRKKADILARL
jgi:hypothetical protein